MTVPRRLTTLRRQQSVQPHVKSRLSRPLRTRLFVFVLVAGAALPAAMTPGVAGAQAAADSTPPFEGSASLAFAQSRGNSNALTTNVTNKLTYSVGEWAVGQDLAFFYGEADSEVTANFWNGGFRGDRALSPRLGAYVVTRFDRNALQGIASRFEEGIGLRYKVIDAPSDRLTLALGGSIFQQQLTAGSVSTIKRNYPAARSALDYKHLFAPKAYFQQTAEYLPNLRDSESYLINTESSLVAPLLSRLAVTIGYVVRYNAMPPVRDNVALRKTDTFLSTGVSYTF